MAADAYRPEIDGLRAVAVGAVLLFHADVRGFSGGYLGVDIFFVISGFLITRIILREQEAGRFSFAQFYLRRLRRLGPALLATIAATLAAGALFLTPEHMRSLGALYVWAMPKIHSAPQWFRETLTSGSLAAILGAAMLFDEGSRVPGLAALPPALAAAAIILSGDGAASRVLLQNPLSVFLGRIS